MPTLQRKRPLRPAGSSAATRLLVRLAAPPDSAQPRRHPTRADSGLGADVTSAAYYRREDERAREACVNSKDPEAILRWLKIAKDYHALADAMEAEERRLSPALRLPTQHSQPQQQPVQQQQSKTEPNDKT